MRKWTRDRSKRRKETDKPQEPAPAPLQPAFYDNPAPTAAAPVEREVTEAAPEPEPQESIAAPSEPRQRPARPEGSDPRRRRRRGGRGRGRSSASRGASAAPVAPADASSAPVEGAEPQASAPAAAPSAAARPSRGVVVLAIGLPGSGKSSWFKRNNITPLSSDLLRTLLFDDATEQRFQDLVFSNLRSMLKARLIARRPANYVDATNLTSQERQGWIKLAKDYGYDVQAVYFDVPLEVCLQRNIKRTRVVGEDVLRRMAAKLKPPAFTEGFSKITVVKVKQKEEPAEA